MHLKTKNVVRKAKFVTYVTEKFLQEEYPSKAIQVACSNVILNKPNINDLNNRIEKIENIHNNQKIILGTIGAIDVKYKGQKYVIKAISKLNKLGYNFEYEMIGGGNKSNLEKLIQKYKLDKQVRIIGSKKHDEIFTWLENIDIYIQPSKTEGLPRALIEAMSKACPCIGTTAGGIPELLNKNMIFKKGNYNELIKILKELSKEEMKSQSKVNFEKSKEYEREKLQDKRDKFYKIIMKDINL